MRWLGNSELLLKLIQNPQRKLDLGGVCELIGASNPFFVSMAES